MICENCKVKIEKNSRFCHNCGANLKNDSSAHDEQRQIDTEPNNRYTAKEYLAETNIKNIKEAERYLRELKILFWVVFLSSSASHSLLESKNELAFIFLIFNICFIVYYIYFCIKLLKVEKLPIGNAWFCIIFAPISWLYLYPLIANPLKIILGKKQLPIRLSDIKKQEINEKSKRHWKIVSIIFGILIFLWLAGAITTYFFSR